MTLPICFTKKELLAQTQMSDARIHRAIQSNTFIQLKNGLYILSDTYLHEPDKIGLTEFVASQKLYTPSYISLEYVLRKYGMLSSTGAGMVTCVTTKTNRTFENFLGNFSYSNMKSTLFCGFENMRFAAGDTIHIATKGKALFDYFYLKTDLSRRNMKQLRQQIFHELGLNWEYFLEEDFVEFDRFVWKSGSAKMERIWWLLREHFQAKKFEVWAKELLK